MQGEMSNNYPVTLTQSEIIPVRSPDIKDILDQYGFCYAEEELYLHIGPSSAAKGWVLHLSVIRMQLTDMLKGVLPYLQETKVTFDIIKDKETARDLQNGDYGSGYLGKIVAIYTENNTQAVYLARQLVVLTQDLRGPAVLTDHFLAGSVYVSYGNDSIPFILPKGVEWPFGEIRPYIPFIKKKLWSYKYRPLCVIKNDFKGRVVKGNYFKNLVNIQFCLIKEGVKNMWTDDFGRDITDRLLWQYELYRELSGSIPTPHIFDLFQEENNTYLVMEFIKGDSLYHKIQSIYESNSWFMLSPLRKLELTDNFLKIANVIRQLHEKGYVHRDITPANFLIDKKESIFLIDMELTYSLFQQKPTPPFKQGTPGFMSPEQTKGITPTVKEDIYALGALMIHIFTGMSPLKLEPSADKLRNRLNNFTDSKRIISLIVACMDDTSSKRPDILTIIEEIQTFRQELENASSINTPSVILPPDEQLLRTTIQNAINGLIHPLVLSETLIWKSFTRPDEAVGTPPVEQAPQPGLHNGIAGIVYFIAKAKKAGFDVNNCMSGYYESWCYLRTRWLDTSTDLKVGLMEGYAGIALAIQEGIQSGLLNPDEYQECLQKCFETSATEDNLVNGISGQLVSLVQSSSQLDPTFTHQQLQRYIGILLNHQQKDGSWNVFRKPNDKVIGMTYGVTGILYSLLAYALHQKDSKVDNAIEKGLQWLLKRARTKKGGIYWTTTTKSRSVDHWTLAMGTTGIALTFLKAYEWSKNSHYRQIAEKALLQFPTHAVHNDFSQIHGLAGLGEVYLEANRILQESEWQRRADWLANLFVNTTLGNNAGYWAMNSFIHREPELLHGSNGIAHFLIRYSNSKPMPYIF